MRLSAREKEIIKVRKNIFSLIFVNNYNHNYQMFFSDSNYKNLVSKNDLEVGEEHNSNTYYNHQFSVKNEITRF